MCSIFGALVWNQFNDVCNLETNRFLETMYRTAHLRGRDGRGYSVHSLTGGRVTKVDTANVDFATLKAPTVEFNSGRQVVIGNTRAEPTTEFVREKKDTDQQPYGNGEWQIVHNGTIANDAALRDVVAFDKGMKTKLMVKTKVDSAAIVETLELNSLEEGDAFEVFCSTVQALKGSYAILATSGRVEEIYVAANYRPIWYVTTGFGVFFASTRDSFPRDYVPQMVQPYSVMYFAVDKNGKLQVHKRLLNPPTVDSHKALVVCSGGLDSVVSAMHAKEVLGHQIELIHFHYGSRAGDPELKAIMEVAEFMGVKLHVKMLPMWDREDSPLLQSDSKIAGGEAGAEFAHEWVPARNLVMLAVATAFAEAKGFKYIVLGNNLEEAGAYPDNEPEFIDKFNDMLPFAVGDGKKVTVVMPVGNMMKHEIVKLGHEIGAPMHLTWSCYRAGRMHCGKCGPCFMRRTAFEINKLPEVIQYEA
jgi:7-cyano-7-deazaguanine synthase